MYNYDSELEGARVEILEETRQKLVTERAEIDRLVKREEFLKKRVRYYASLLQEEVLAKSKRQIYQEEKKGYEQELHWNRDEETKQRKEIRALEWYEDRLEHREISPELLRLCIEENRRRENGCWCCS